MNTNIIELKKQMVAINKEIDSLTTILSNIEAERKNLFRDRVAEMSVAARIHEARRILAIAEYVS